MTVFRIKGITHAFIIEPGLIYNVNIENRIFAYNVVKSIKTPDDDMFMLYDKVSLVDINENILFIHNVFDIDPNSKKIINALYKKISIGLSGEDKDKIQIINQLIMELLGNKSLDMNIPAEYECDLDINKILSLYKYGFANDSGNLMENLIVFLKAYKEICNVKVVVIYNFLNYLSESDVELLKDELSLLNCTLINIEYEKKLKHDSIKSLYIDGDLCEF